jgi:hypothetical protein
MIGLLVQKANVGNGNSGNSARGQCAKQLSLLLLLLLLLACRTEEVSSPSSLMRAGAL